MDFIYVMNFLRMISLITELYKIILCIFFFISLEEIELYLIILDIIRFIDFRLGGSMFIDFIYVMNILRMISLIFCQFPIEPVLNFLYTP